MNRDASYGWVGYLLDRLQSWSSLIRLDLLKEWKPVISDNSPTSSTNSAMLIE